MVMSPGEFSTYLGCRVVKQQAEPVIRELLEIEAFKLRFFQSLEHVKAQFEYLHRVTGAGNRWSDELRDQWPEEVPKLCHCGGCLLETSEDTR